MSKSRSNSADDFETIAGKVCLKDGRRYFAGMTFMDAARSAHRAPPPRGLVQLITDGGGRGGVALNRPGFRIRSDDTASANAKAAAYQHYETELCDAWKNPTADARRTRKAKYDPRVRLAGTEEMEEEETDDAAAEKECPVCACTAQMMRDHQNKMTDIYDKLDRELSEAWRQ